MPELLQTADACKLIDERGVVVGLQHSFVDEMALQVAQTKPSMLQKIFHIGQSFTSSAASKD